MSNPAPPRSPEEETALEQKALLAGATRRLRTAIYDVGELRPFISFKAVGGQYGEQQLMDDIDILLQNTRSLARDPLPDFVQTELRRAERDWYATDAQKALKYLFDRLSTPTTPVPTEEQKA